MITIYNLIKIISYLEQRTGSNETRLSLENSIRF